jgi:hypothetical protein
MEVTRPCGSRIATIHATMVVHAHVCGILTATKARAPRDSTAVRLFTTNALEPAFNTSDPLMKLTATRLKDRLATLKAVE